MLSIITPIVTSNTQQLHTDPINPRRQQRDQTPPTSRPGRYLYNT